MSKTALKIRQNIKPDSLIFLNPVRQPLGVIISTSDHVLCMYFDYILVDYILLNFYYTKFTTEQQKIYLFFVSLKMLGQ